MSVAPKTEINLHNKYAPYWATTLIMLGVTSLSTNWLNWGAFWKGYVLDMAGPAWIYILFRGLYAVKTNNAWILFFTPIKTLVIFILVCIGIEMAQYMELYDATFDIWDFPAYISILVPVFAIDLYLNGKQKSKDQLL